MFGFGGGVVTARDRSELSRDELQVGTGIYYKKGDPHRAHVAWNEENAQFGTVEASKKVLGAYLAEFDSATDKIVAYADTDFYTADAGASGTFASAKGSLNASGANLAGIHANDRHYFGNGYDTNWVLESDGTVRDMGMGEPTEDLNPTPTAASGTVNRPNNTVSNSGWTNAANAYDSDTDSYANATLSSGTATLEVDNTTGSLATIAGTRVYVKYGIFGLPIDSGDIPSGRSADTWDVTVKIELSINNGSTFTETLLNQTFTSSQGATTVSSSDLSAVDRDDIHIKVTVTYNSGTKSASVYLYDVKYQDAAAGSNFSTSNGVYYCLTELDQTRGLESAPTSPTALVTLSTQNAVNIDLPDAAVNSNATHFALYRTHDGGAAYKDCRLIGTWAISEAGNTVQDDFSVGKDDTSQPILALVRITSENQADIYYPRHSAPQSFIHMDYYQGSVIGVRRDSPRELWWSDPEFPESWPEFQVVTSFPMQRNDSLVGTVPVGESLLILAAELVMRLDGLPQVISGVLTGGAVHPVRGQPGCVGRQAFTAYSVHGEPRAAWVSSSGVHTTDGFQAVSISDDIDWENTVSVANLSSAVLTWDEENGILVLDYPSGSSGNDRTAYIHMRREHVENGQPKWTLPHTTSVASRAAGYVNGTYRMYNGDWADGIMYLRGGQTSSVSLKSGRQYGNRDLTAGVSRASLYHTNFGSGETCTVTWESGRDGASNTQSISKTVSLNGQQLTDFWVGRGGDWHEVTVAYTGGQAGAFKHITVHGDPQSERGKSRT